MDNKLYLQLLKKAKAVLLKWSIPKTAFKVKVRLLKKQTTKNFSFYQNNKG